MCARCRPLAPRVVFVRFGNWRGLGGGCLPFLLGEAACLALMRILLCVARSVCHMR